MGLVGYTHDWEEEARFREESKDLIDFWSVEMSLPTDGPTEIQAAVPFMRQFAKHPKINGAFLLEFRSKRIPGLNTFKVELEYSTNITANVNPLSIPPLITGGFVARQVPRLVDANGKPKCNTAGDLFDDPAPLVTVYDRVYKIAKNVPTSLPDWTDGYINCVNSDTVRLKGRDWPPKTVLYVPGTIGQDDIGGPQNTPFIPVDFELHCREDGWTTYIPNRGYNELIELAALTLSGTPLSAQDQVLSTGQQLLLPGQLPDDQVVGLKKGKRYLRRKIYVGPARENPTDPQFLDKQGRAIAVPSVDNIVLLPFEDYTPVPFNILPLK